MNGVVPSPVIGDVVLFHGHGVLSWLIEAIAGQISHCATVVGEDLIAESTILKGQDGVTRNGVQFNSLAWRASQYDTNDQAVWLLKLAPSWQPPKLDLSASYTYALQEVGKVNYSKAELLEDLIAFLTDGAANEFHPDDHAQVCSEFLFNFFDVAGYPGAKAAFGSKPEQIVGWPIWSAVYQIGGLKPMELAGFKPVQA